VLVRDPAVYEKAQGHEDRSGDHERDAEFRLANVVITLFQGNLYSIVDRRADLSAQEKANTKRDIVEAADAGLFVVDVGPNPWERRKNEVHNTINVCPIYRSVLVSFVFKM
jgi:hypothetical protein